MDVAVLIVVVLVVVAGSQYVPDQPNLLLSPTTREELGGINADLQIFPLASGAENGVLILDFGNI